jgi:hypothetical protein
MHLIGRRPLLRAGMVGSARHALGRRREGDGLEAQARPAVASAPAPAAVPASAESERIDALTKLKGLLDSGVLTPEQYESERRRLTAGI